LQIDFDAGTLEKPLIDSVEEICGELPRQAPYPQRDLCRGRLGEGGSGSGSRRSGEVRE
jgi:hypothetical protein